MRPAKIQKEPISSRKFQSRDPTVNPTGGIGSRVLRF